MGTGMPTAMHLYFVAYVHELIRVGQLFYKEQYISLSINTWFFPTMHQKVWVRKIRMPGTSHCFLGKGDIIWIPDRLLDSLESVVTLK